MKSTGNGIQEGAASLGEALKTNNTLNELDLSCQFFNKLCKWCQLKHEFFLPKIGNMVWDIYVVVLSEALETNTALTMIDLSGKNRISWVMFVWKKNKRLRSVLIPTGNCIANLGARFLSNSLVKNSGLRKLYLNCRNDFTKHTKQSLLWIVHSQTDNSIEDNGAESFGQALKKNTTLKELYLMSFINYFALV